MSKNIVKLSANVDYITVTVRDDKNRQFLADYGYILLTEESSQEFPRISYWNKMGYTGYSVPGFNLGERHQDLMISASSERAREVWADLVQYADSVSRFDIAVTVWYNSDHREIARNYWEVINTMQEERSLGREYSIIQGLTGGDTLYVGKRSSSQFGRIYDKMRQGGKEEYTNAWRFEVEYKKPLSDEAAKQVFLADDRETCIASMVSEWFTSRLLPTPFQGSDEYSAIRTKRKETVLEEKLNWLRVQIAPTVNLLVSAGYRDSVLEALGIWDSNQQ